MYFTELGSFAPRDGDVHSGHHAPYSVSPQGQLRDNQDPARQGRHLTYAARRQVNKSFLALRKSFSDDSGCTFLCILPVMWEKGRWRNGVTFQTKQERPVHFCMKEILLKRDV